MSAAVAWEAERAASDGAADAAPEIGFPTGLAAYCEVVVSGGFAYRVGRPVLGNIFTLDSWTSGELGEEGGASRGYLIAGGQIGLYGLAQALVVGGDVLFELVELRVLVDLPPFTAQHAVGGGSRLPTASDGGGGWSGNCRSAVSL